MTTPEGDETRSATRRSRIGARIPGVGASSPASAISIEPAYTVIDRLRHLHEAPLRNVRQSIWWIRKTFFSRPRSQSTAFLVDLSKPEVVRLFGLNHFEPGWELSYHYRGEVLNLRRPEFVDDEPYEWWQVHIRGYLHDDGGIELTAHFETEPSEHPDAHVRMFGLDIQRGMETIRRIIEAEGVDYELVGSADSPSDPG